MNPANEPNHRHQVHSFAPINPVGAHALVLGSMPGVASLKATQYYAHPRNAFWPIIQAIVDGNPPSFAALHSLTYAQRKTLAAQAGIAVWDVLARCNRRGSLDSAIEMSSSVPNDVSLLLHKNPTITLIALNGKTAAKLYQRHHASDIASIVKTQDRPLAIHVLPSTSPAMAPLTLAAQFANWQVISAI